MTQVGTGSAAVLDAYPGADERRKLAILFRTFDPRAREFEAQSKGCRTMTGSSDTSLRVLEHRNDRRWSGCCSTSDNPEFGTALHPHAAQAAIADRGVVALHDMMMQQERGHQLIALKKAKEER